MVYEKPKVEKQEQGEGLRSPFAPNPPVIGTLSSGTVGFVL